MLAETHTQRVFNTSKCVRARRCAQYLAMIALQGEDGAIWTGFKQFPGQLANLKVSHVMCQVLKTELQLESTRTQLKKTVAK